MIVYLIENTVNGKRYVGKTVYTLSNRWSLHKSEARRGSNNPFHRAIRKYGIQAFTIKELIKCDSLEVLTSEERRLIIELETHVSKKGYNATWGGDGTESGEKHPLFGVHRSEETKAKISKANKGKNNGSSRARGENHWNRGRIRTEETRTKLREARRAQGSPQPVGFRHSDVTKEIIRQKRANQVITPAMLNALAEGRKNRQQKLEKR